jgi:hypothetical protein
MNITPESRTTEELFTSGSFEIPMFQRAFSWEEEQVQDLLRDIRLANNDDHFVGPIVVITDEGKAVQDLVDGQQRMTILQVCLSVIRDRYRSLGNIPKEAIVGNLVRSHDSHHPRLRLGRENRDFFQKFIVEDQQLTDHPLLEDGKKPADVSAADWRRNKKLAKAYSVVAKHVIALDAEGLETFSRVVRNQLRFVRIAVTDFGDAFQLFETLNYRGLELSAADLLKNFLLEKRSGELGPGNYNHPDLGILLAEWEALVEKVTPSRMNSQFIRYYLLMTHSDDTIQKKRIYKHFRDMVTAQTADEVIGALKRAGNAFAEANKPALIGENPRHQKLGRALESVGRVGVDTTRIALMAILMHIHNDNQALKAIAVVESLAFRWIVCGMNAQDLETIFAKFAKQIHASAGAELDEALRKLRDQIPKNARFIDAFASQDRRPIARYVLDKLEIALNGPDFGQAAHVEHIMPQTFSDPWAGTYAEGTDYAELVHRWGNLTLLAKEINWVAGNDGWSRKVIAYKVPDNAYFPNGRQIKLTSALLELPDWNESFIKARQQWMAQLAVLVWPEDGAHVPGAVTGPPDIMTYLFPPEH